VMGSFPENCPAQRTLWIFCPWSVSRTLWTHSRLVRQSRASWDQMSRPEIK
jgi:hypothetical protein